MAVNLHKNNQRSSGLHYIKNPALGLGFEGLAERTGLEPATPGVTGRYSNQLNYRSGRFTADCGIFGGC